MINFAALLADARALAPPGVALAAADPTRPTTVWPHENLPRSIPKRQTEFAAGRSCARAAMAALGLPPTAIPHGPDRAPVWPFGLHGSITHSASACLAAITLAPRLIGADLEPATPLDPSLWQTLMLPSERAALARSARPALTAKLIFSAKEAAYKAQYLRSRTLLDFEALEITLGPQTFTARFTTAIPGFAKDACLHGRFCETQGHWLTLSFT
jgi:4'-phosphopantetheinyl transferase EntD